MRRQLLLLSVVIGIVMLGGCATGAPPTHQATVNSESDGALVSGHRSWAPWNDSVWVHAVDGLKIPPWVIPHSPILVDPGNRSLTVWGNNWSARLWEVTLKATLLAGHVYKVQFERDENLMTFWVEDVTTRETVSEKQSAYGNINWGGNPFPFLPIK